MSEPAPKEERKKSGCLRWAVWSSLMLFLGPLLTVVGVLWFVLGSEDAGNLLLGRVQSDVLARLPGCVEYSGFSGELGSDINLSDVVIRERDADGGCTGPEALRAKSLHLEWDVWALANRFEVDVTALEIVEPVVHVRLRSAVDGKPPGLNWLDIFVDVTKPKKPKDLKEPQKGPAKLPRISAEKVTIVGDGRVLVLRDEQPLVDAQAIGLDASYELVRGRHYVRLHGLHVEPKVPVQLEPVDIAGRFELGAEAPHRAELQRLLAALQADDPAATLDGKTVFAIEAKPLSLKYPGIDSSLEVTGDLRLAGGPLFDFGIRSDGLQLDALHVIPKKDSEPQPLPLRGRVALDLTAKGGLDGLAVTGSVSQLDAEKPSASLHLDEVFVDVLGRPMMHRARLRLVDFDLERLIGRRTDQALSSSYVAGLFDFYAESFDAHLTGKLRYTAPEVLERLLQSAFGDMDGWADRAVDLGCGTGLCGTMLRPHCRYLLGVDLAPRMIEKARANDAYDDLVVGDVVEVLAGYSAPFDLVIAADVTTYLGALNPLFASVAAGHGPGGRFGLTVHALEAGDFAIGWAGTYQHSATYVEAMAASVGLSVELTERGAMRYDDGQPLETLYYILRKPF